MSSTNYKSVLYRFGTEKIKDDDSSEYGLHVVNFYGEEAISRPYWFRLNLTSRDANLDPEDFVNLPGRLSIIRGDQTSYIHGIVSSFELCGRDGDWFMYRAMLSPRLWALSLTHQSRAFQNRSVPEIVRMILEDHGVPHKIEVRESYPSKQYVVQYNETDLAFISRLLAHDGIRFGFVQEEQREVMHLFDSRGQDPWVEGPTEVAYRVSDGLVGNNEYISEFILREQAVPGKVVLRDYNFRDQHADLTAEQETKQKGAGEVYEYGSHHKDRSEGDRLIKVRQEEVDSQQRLIGGRSSCIGFRAGHRFTLTHHDREDLNEDYLLVRVRHFGGQEQQFGMAGGRDFDESGLGQDYRNEFGCAPAMVSFRTPRLTIVNNFFSESFFNAMFESRFSPAFDRITGDTIVNVVGERGGTDHGKFYGLMTANVVGDGPYAAVDENGDYLATIPFDREGVPSRPMRLAQPYAGPGDAGFHFPAHAGNEIVFGCVDGDPDRPLALGFVPNPDHSSPISSGNSSQHVIRTTSNNEIIIEDNGGQESILLHVPNQGDTLLSIGNHVDLGKVGAVISTDDDVLIVAKKLMDLKSDDNMSLITKGDMLLHALEKTMKLESAQQMTLKAGNNMLLDTRASMALVAKNNIALTSDDDMALKTPSKYSVHGGDGVTLAAGAISGETASTVNSALSVVEAAVGIRSGGFGAAAGAVGLGQSFLASGLLLTGTGGVDIATPASASIKAANGVSVLSTTTASVAAAHDIGIKSVFGKIEINADQEIMLKCGGAKIVMRSNGEIEITGKKLYEDVKEIECKTNRMKVKAAKDFVVDSLETQIKAKTKLVMEAKAKIEVEAKAKLRMAGSIAEVAGKAIAAIKGALTKTG